jgi:hypothetical protein
MTDSQGSLFQGGLVRMVAPAEEDTLTLALERGCRLFASTGQRPCPAGFGTGVCHEAGPRTERYKQDGIPPSAPTKGLAFSTKAPCTTLCCTTVPGTTVSSWASCGTNGKAKNPVEIQHRRQYYELLFQQDVGHAL